MTGDGVTETEERADGATEGLFLTVRETRRINRYLAWAAEQVGVDPAWDVWVAAEPADSGTMAQINPTEGRYTAAVHVAQDWLEMEPQEQAEALLHEVTHLLHKRIDEPVRKGLFTAMNSLEGEPEDGEGAPPLGFMALYCAIYEMHRIETEYMVDRLTSVFARLLPVHEVWARMGAEEE